MKMEKDRAEEFYTIDELCKLRRATTNREIQAFFWFMGEFMECICGVRAWKSVKQSMLVSEAKDAAGCKIVTKSDEAFGLLLIENYLEKWKKRPVAGTEEEEVDGSETPSPSASGRKRMVRRETGKYTTKRKGNTCKFGGWSAEGMTRFNDLYNMVKADRVSETAKEMEELLRMHCRRLAGNHQPDDGTPREGGLAGSNDARRRDKEVEVLPVEAAWDSEDE